MLLLPCRLDRQREADHIQSATSPTALVRLAWFHFGRRWECCSNARGALEEHSTKKAEPWGLGRGFF